VNRTSLRAYPKGRIKGQLSKLVGQPKLVHLMRGFPGESAPPLGPVVPDVAGVAMPVVRDSVGVSLAEAIGVPDRGIIDEK
jgi:hypothetical protein